MYLDAKSDTYLEEVSSCNIFVVKGRTIKTPPLAGTILPGVTRRSIIELARSKGYEVVEDHTSVTEAMEVGGEGAACVVCSGQHCRSYMLSELLGVDWQVITSCWVLV